MQLAKELYKILIVKKQPLFVDTNIYKYYVQYRSKDLVLPSSKHNLDLISSKILLDFLIKYKIVIKENKMLEKEINDVIINSENEVEKHYYEELKNLLNIDSNSTSYSENEENLAKQLAPKSKVKKMDQDFIIVICCKKDNTKVIVTKDKTDFNKCLSEYLVNKDKFNDINSEIKLIKLDQVPLLITHIKKIIMEMKK